MTATAFVRRSSGLRRDVSLLDTIAFSISSQAPGAALGSIGLTTILLPSMSGVNLIYGSLIAWLLIIPEIIVYTMLTTRIPRTGGDYVWVSRVFGGMWGGSFALMGYIFESIAFGALLALTAVFTIGSVGVSLGYQNMLSLALPGNVPGSNPTLQFVVAVIIFIIAVLVPMFKPKAGFQMMAILTVFGFLTAFVGMFVLVSIGQGGVIHYMNNLNAIGANATYTSVAKSYSGPTFQLWPTIMLLPFFSIFIYPWMNVGPAIASEIKSKTALRWNVLVSSVLTFLLVTAGFGCIYYAGGFSFINGALANPTLVYNYSFNFWTLAMGVSNNVVVAWLIGLGWIAFLITSIVELYVAISRYMFALAFDRFLPEKIAYVSPKYASPTVAFAIILGSGIFLIGGASFLYGSLVSLYGTVVGAMVYFLVVGVASFVYANKKEKGGSKALLQIAGGLMAVIFLFIAYEFLAYPAIWGGNLFAYGYVVVTFLLGLVIYTISKAYYSKRGIDITLTFKELPPL